MKLTIVIELSHEEEIYLRDNSVERVLNNAFSLAIRAPNAERSAAIQDIPEIKPLVTKLWSAAQNALYVLRSL